MTTQFTLTPEATPTMQGSSIAVAALCARLLLSVVFLLSGISKLANPGGTLAYIASAGLPLPEFCYGMAVLIEILGAVLLIVGYKTRMVATVLATFSVAAAVAFHHDIGDQGQLIHFLKNLAIAGGLLQIVAFGPGHLSVDGKH